MDTCAYFYKKRAVMTTSVSSTDTQIRKIVSSTATNALSEAGTGIDTTTLSSIINGDASGITGQVCSSLGLDETTSALLEGVADIVATVLAGNYKMGADTKEAVEEYNEINKVSDSAKSQGDVRENEAKGYQEQGEGTIQGHKDIADEAGETVKTITDETNTQIEELKQENEKKEEEIKNNEEQIAQKQEEQSALLAKINSSGQSGSQTSSSSGGSALLTGDDSSGADESGMPQQITCSDPSLQEDVSKYNSIVSEISGLTAKNTELREGINTNNATISALQENAVKVTDEQNTRIDEAVNSITSTASSTQSAIQETKNLLEGEFPQFDEIMLIKLATAMTKASICGTQSGILAAAAAAMGVGSIFSFGSTAAKAAELTAAAKDQTAASAKHIWANAAGKVLEKIAQSYVTNVMTNITSSIGGDFAQFGNEMLASVMSMQSSLPTDYKSSEGKDNNNGSSQNESDGNDDNKDKILKTETA